MNLLDGVIRCLSLARLDVEAPDVATFTTNATPSGDTLAPHSNLAVLESSLCPCDQQSLGSLNPAVFAQVPSWGPTQGFDPAWSVAEIRKDECRRLVWIAVAILAREAETAYLLGRPFQSLFMTDPTNVRTLY